MSKEMAIDEIVSEMNELITAVTVAETENNIVPRFNQPKTVAYVDAEFRVHDDVPEAFRYGIFSKPNSYPAKIRFANASKRHDAEKDVRGLSIRLSNVKGSVLWGDTGKQDFILNSHPALFVAKPEDFLEFIRARKQGTLGMLLFFLNPFNPHFKSLVTVLNSRKSHLSPLDIRYWSTVPYRLGDQVVKYSVIPCSDYKTLEVVNPGEHQLRGAVAAHLQQAPACFQFAVQKQTDPKSMPIEDASVVWDEGASPFIPIATIKIENQKVEDPDTLAEGERCSFNPWQCLPEHEPLGRMNLVRREVYATAAQLRNHP